MERSLDCNEIGRRCLNGRPKEKYPYQKNKNLCYSFSPLWSRKNSLFFRRYDGILCLRWDCEYMVSHASVIILDRLTACESPFHSNNNICRIGHADSAFTCMTSAATSHVTSRWSDPASDHQSDIIFVCASPHPASGNQCHALFPLRGMCIIVIVDSDVIFTYICGSHLRVFHSMDNFTFSTDCIYYLSPPCY